MNKFRTYQLAKQLFQEASGLRLPAVYQNQFQRALLSIPLNLAEGSAKTSNADRKRFYEIALGSLREVQSMIDLLNLKPLEPKANQLGAHLFCLIRSLQTR